MSRRLGIYAITNSVNGKRYVGSAVNITNRWAVHLNLLRAGRHHSVKLQRAWDKHGEAAFVFSVIEAAKEARDLIQREQFFIDSLGAVDGGYNVSRVAGSTLGRKVSDAQRARLSILATGRVHSKNTREKMSISQSLRASRKQTASTRRKIAEKAIGRVASLETRLKMSAAHRGKEKSTEHRQKIGASQVGKIIPADVRIKMSIAAKVRATNCSRRANGCFGAEHSVKFEERTDVKNH